MAMKPKLKSVPFTSKVPRTQEEKADAAKLRAPKYTGKFFSGSMCGIVDNLVAPPQPQTEEKK